MKNQTLREKRDRLSHILVADAEKLKKRDLQASRVLDFHNNYKEWRRLTAILIGTKAA